MPSSKKGINRLRMSRNHGNVHSCVSNLSFKLMHLHVVRHHPENGAGGGGGEEGVRSVVLFSGCLTEFLFNKLHKTEPVLCEGPYVDICPLMLFNAAL